MAKWIEWIAKHPPYSPNLVRNDLYFSETWNNEWRNYIFQYLGEPPENIDIDGKILLKIIGKIILKLMQIKLNKNNYFIQNITFFQSFPIPTCKSIKRAWIESNPSEGWNGRISTMSQYPTWTTTAFRIKYRFIEWYVDNIQKRIKELTHSKVTSNLLFHFS